MLENKIKISHGLVIMYAENELNFIHQKDIPVTLKLTAIKYNKSGKPIEL